VAVMLAHPEGQYFALKAARLSVVSPRLEEQGLLDQMVEGLRSKFEETPPTLPALRELHENLRGTLTVTEPRPAAVIDDETHTLDILFKAFIRPPSGGSRGMTKGRLLDRIVPRLRRGGLTVSIGQYIENHLFDLIVKPPDRPQFVCSAISFAHGRKMWADTERDAGHFLFAIDHTGIPGVGIIQPPAAGKSHENAFESHERVMMWFKEKDVPALEPEQAWEPEVLLQYARVD
jgi:hypothetical protein